MAPVTAASPPACLLLVFPDASLVRQATKAGLDVQVMLDEQQNAEDFPLSGDRVIRADGGSRVEVASVIRRLVGEHGVTHVLDGEGFPVRRILLETENPEGADPFRRELLPIGQSARKATAVPMVEETAEVVVTTLTVDGMHRVVGFTAHLPVPGGRSYIYPASLPEIKVARVRAAVTSMLDLFGHEFGPAQTWVALTGAEPKVLRSEPRFSVDQISSLIEIATGFDVRVELFRALAGASLQPPRPRWFAAVRFFRLPGSAPEDEESCVFAEGVSQESTSERLDATRAAAIGGARPGHHFCPF
ncbi:MAG TPA: hypothetical protein VFG35_02940 [Actinoplanes sp.]|nr:hypothetical protein [Actinoplanes sp.]